MIFDSLQQSAAGGSGGSSGGGLITQDAVVTVGAGGDYPTITAALEYLGQFAPAYKGSPVNAEIQLLAGFVMSEQVVVSGLNLGWITITGVDLETVIDISGFTEVGGGLSSAFLGMDGSVLPVIGQLFDMQQTGYTDGFDGISVIDGSCVKVLPGCGVKNAGYSGLRADRSALASAEYADFSGAGKYGILSDHGSSVNADRSIVDASQQGYTAYSGGKIVASYGSAKSCQYYGFRADRGGSIVADYSDARYCSTYGYYVDGGSFIVLTNYYTAASVGGAVNQYTANGAYLV